MSVFDDFLKEVLTTTKDAAGSAAADFLDDATSEGTAFRRDAEENLLRWKGQLDAGELDAELMQSLIRGQWDMAVLASLAKAGKTAADAKALTGKILNAAVGAAFSFIPGGPAVHTLAKVGVSVAKTVIETKVAARAAAASVPPAAPAPVAPAVPAATPASAEPAVPAVTPAPATPATPAAPPAPSQVAETPAPAPTPPKV